MAKKSMIAREVKRKKLHQQYKITRMEIKNRIRKLSSFDDYIRLQNKLQSLPRNSSACRLRNRCWATGRSRGVYRHFGLSRHMLREMSHQCLLPGIKKSSW